MSILGIQHFRQFSVAGGLSRELGSWSKQTDVQSEKALAEIGARAAGLLLTPLAVLVDLVAHTLFAASFVILGVIFLPVQAVAYLFKAEEIHPFFKEMLLTSAFIEVGRVVQFVALLALSPLAALSSPKLVKHLSQDFLLDQSKNKIKVLEIELEKTQHQFEDVRELESKDDQIEQLMNRNRVLFEEQIIDLENENISFQEQINEKKSVIEELKSERKQLSLLLGESETLTQTQAMKLEKKKAKIYGLNAEIESLAGKLLDLEAAKLKLEAADLKRQREALSSSNIKNTVEITATETLEDKSTSSSDDKNHVADPVKTFYPGFFESDSSSE